MSGQNQDLSPSSFDSTYCDCLGFPDDTVVKNTPVSAGDTGLTPHHKDPLEEEMATHSSILAWKIPWTEDPGRLQSVGSQTVGHN